MRTLWALPRGCLARSHQGVALGRFQLIDKLGYPKSFSGEAHSAANSGVASNERSGSPRGNAICAPSRQPDPAHAVLAIIGITTVFRVLVSMMLGLGVDESYMVAMGRDLRLSYFDHPPLGWWLSWGASHLFGSERPVVVRLPFIALFAASTGLMYRLTAILFSRQAGLWAALAFNISPVFGVTSASWVLPDGPLITALLGVMICLARAASSEGRRSWAWWLSAGVCGGLALLSKYTAILVLFGAAVAILTHPVQRRWLLRPQPWLSVALAAALFLPVIVWNAQHHWCSVAFQGGRALGSTWRPLAPLIALSGEALYLLPWIWLPLMTTLASAWRRGQADWPSWMLGCSGTPPIVLFALVGIWSRAHVLFHWAAPGYLVLFPLLGAGIAQSAPAYGRAPRRIAAASACLIVAGATVVGTEARWNWLPLIGADFAPGTDPDVAAIDWTSLVPEMQARGWIGSDGPIIAALNWHDAGKLDYVLGGAATVICLGDDSREFGLVRPAATYQGDDVLILLPGKRPAQFAKSLGMLFERIEPEPPLTVLHAGRPAMEIAVYLGRHLATPGNGRRRELDTSHHHQVDASTRVRHLN